MRSAIDARGSTIGAAVALLVGVGLIGGSLLRVGHRASSIDVVSWTVPAPVKAVHDGQSAAPNVVARESHVTRRATPVRLPSTSPGLPETVGATALDDLALPLMQPPAVGARSTSPGETPDGLATAATELGDSVARSAQKAGARTAGFFKRVGKKVAASFGR